IGCERPPRQLAAARGGGGSLARKCRPCYRIRKASKDCGRRLKPAATAFFIGGAPTVPPDCQGQYTSCSAISPRRLVKTARAAKDSATLATARQAVHWTKLALGEWGPVWWSDGTPDFNRYLKKISPYAAWYEMQQRG